MSLLLLATLVGCFSERDYAQEYWQANCEQILECYNDDALSYLDYTDTQGCLDYYIDEVDRYTAEKQAEDCAYDGKAARDCVDGFAALSCDAFLSNDFPQSCQDICGGG